jgi:guanylate kinase
VKPQGLLVLISAPSGAGKDTVIHRLLPKLPDGKLYVTATSRPPRAGEVQGVDYYFYTPEKFREAIEDGLFLEWSIVHDDYKGVRKDALAETLRDHAVVVVQTDPQGMRKLKAMLPGALSIFIMPPSIESLRRRLEQRGTETPKTLDLRLRNAKIEMAAAPEYDYVVVNDDDKVEETAERIKDIIIREAERPRTYDLDGS